METDQAPSPFVIATYEEIRLRFGLGGTDQARIKAKRRGWEPEPPNHPGAITRIRVPRTAWEEASECDRSAPIDQERSRGTDQKRRPNKDMGGVLAAFREEIDRLRTERDEAGRRLEEERLRASARLEELRAEGEAARIQAAEAKATAEGLRLALEEARRPFWRRWIG
jgi:hypothetical protein